MRSLVLFVLTVAGMAIAQQPQFQDDSFEEELPWMEIQAALPEFPEPADLIAVKGNFGDRKYAVDQRSLKVDKDGVVRFTIIIEADGVKNILYEGIRCETKEHKMYSVGRPNGTWGKIQGQKWQRITNRGMYGYHEMLYKDLFCPARHIVESKEEAIDALKRGMHPRAEPRR